MTGRSVTRLRVDNGRIFLDVSGDRDSEVRAVDAGSLSKVLGRLRDEPPTADQLEAAIADIEDGLMSALRQLPTRRQLNNSWPEALRIAGVLRPMHPSMARLDIAEVEELYGRLADVAYGTPASRLGIPTDRLFAATLLVLRELLHHGGFRSVEIER